MFSAIAGYFEFLVAVVPAAWWPIIDRYFVIAVVVALAAAVVVKVLDWLDLRDGRRDWWLIGTVAPWLSLAVEFVLAVIELGPVQLPKAASLRKFRELWIRAQLLRPPPL